MNETTDLGRFLNAQEFVYELALEEVRRGRKENHWMWYIFPQLRGLGYSNMAWHYGIRDLQEARDYLNHPVLGQRLREITALLLASEHTDPGRIFGGTDSLKLRSCMTLFAQAEEETLFRGVLEKFYGGVQDQRTLELLEKQRCSNS